MIVNYYIQNLYNDLNEAKYNMQTSIYEGNNDIDFALWLNVHNYIVNKQLYTINTKQYNLCNLILKAIYTLKSVKHTIDSASNLVCNL